MSDDPKRPLKVFLCHAHSDIGAVKTLYARLKREGVDVWLDKEKLLPGADWEREIRKAVREADVVVVCLSKQFNQAGFRQKEVRIALEEADKKPEGEIFIIPARLEECDNLESLSKWHWVDLFESNSFQRLILALRVRAEKIGATLRQHKGGHTTVSRTTIKVEQEAAEKTAKEQAEREVAEKARLESEELARQKAVREKEEKESADKMRFEAEELARQKAAEEQAERELVEKAAREKVEKEAAEKARLEAEELARQKAGKEKEEREAAEKAEQDAVEKARLEAEELARQKAAKEKAAREAAEKASKIEKEVQREVEKRIKKAKRDLQWERIKSKIRYWLDIARIYAVPNALFLVGIAFAVYMFISYSKDIPVLNQLLNPTSQPSQISTEIFTPNTTFTSLPSTLAFSPVPPTIAKTPTFTATVAALQEEIVDDKGITMRLVPAGTFTMGMEKPKDWGWTWNLATPHDVYLNSYYMDIYEVTNSSYKQCVDSGVCTPPINSRIYINLGYIQYPVSNVDWNMAKTYCEWRGARLPTEAEWEKAARGIDERNYPWGNDINCSFANYGGCTGYKMSKVGSYESGKSPYGIYDMVGNVSEWVNDWYSDTYYQGTPESNPLGPDSGEYRVLRGGSYNYIAEFAFSAVRYSYLPTDADLDIGFRCARGANP